MTKKKPKEEHLKVGRPSKYNPVYCDEIIKFFDVPHIINVQKTKIDKDGRETTIEVERPNSLPTFERFATEIDVVMSTLVNWRDEHPEFLQAYRQAQQLQKDMLIDLGMLGLYNPTFTIFVAKNITDMRDRHIVDDSVSYSLFEGAVEQKARDLEA